MFTDVSVFMCEMLAEILFYIWSENTIRRQQLTVN